MRHLLSFISLFQAVIEYVKRDPDEEHSEGVYNKGCMRKSVQRTYRLSLLCDLCVLIVLPYIHKGYFQNSILVLLSFLSGVEHFHCAGCSSFDGWNGKPVREDRAVFLEPGYHHCSFCAGLLHSLLGGFSEGLFYYE